jgi:heat shock protein HtpX
MHELIRSNKRRSALLIIGFVVVVTIVGAAVGLLLGGGGIVASIVALLIAGALAFGSYWKADAIALAVSRAHPADEHEYARLHNLVEGLCIASGLPKPGVYVVDDPAPNAFATGRNPQHASIAVTTGLIEKMNRVELEGVVAHELSHIRNYDILVSTLAVTMVGAVALVTDIAIRTMWWNGGRVRRSGDHADRNNPLAFLGFALLILAPIIARLMQAAISRQRETLADVSACQMTRYPPGLISALEKLQADHTATHSASTATAHLWIEQPMSGLGDEGRLRNPHHWFDTHPPLDERIALLREL